MPKATDSEQLAALLSAFDGRLTELVSLMRGTIANATLFSGTVLLDAAGVWTNSWEVPFGAVMVANSGGTTVTVDASSPKNGAPGSGIGVHTCAAGKAGHWRLTGRELTIYGAAGALVDLVVTTDAPDHLIGAASAPSSTTNVIGAGTTVISTSPGVLVGWAYRESAGAAARVSLYDGIDNTGALLVPVSLNPNESTRDFPAGLNFSRLAAVVVTGAAEGSVFTRKSL